MHPETLPLSQVVPVLKTIQGRNVCILSDPKCEMVYASVTLRGGYYTESNPAHLGVTHIIEHIIFESWKKCYAVNVRRPHKNGRGKTVTATKMVHKKQQQQHKTTRSVPGPKKSCLHFWNNRAVVYNGFTDNQVVSAYMYGMASESANIVDYITQMICSCTAHLNMKLLTHVKNTVLNELTAAQTNSMDKLEYELVSRHIAPSIPGASGALQVKNDAAQIENLRRLTPEHIKDYYYRFFIPENAFFFYGGRITEHQIHASIASHLAHQRQGYPTKSLKVNLTFEPNHIFKQTFMSLSGDKKYTVGRRARGVRARGHMSSIPVPVTVVKDPSVKNNANFMIIFPVKQAKQVYDSSASKPIDLSARAIQMQIHNSLVSLELMELLRMENNLVYGVSAQWSTFTGINLFRIFGSCLHSNVEIVIELCLNYVQERQRKKVSESNLDAAKGKFKMETQLNSHSLVSVSRFFEGLIFSAVVTQSQNTASLSDILKGVSLGSYDASVKKVDEVTASDIQTHFKNIGVSNAVKGYSVK